MTRLNRSAIALGILLGFYCGSAPSNAEGHLIKPKSSPVITYDNSPNWSGIYETGHFSYAAGSFNVPSVTPTTTDSDDSLWVGIDGAVDDAYLLQAGVDVTSSGQPTAWVVDANAPVEQLSAYDGVDVPLTIDLGDRVNVLIYRTVGDNWTVAIDDETSQTSWSESVQFDGPDSSAEWIMEDPGGYDGDGLFPFAPFTPIDWKGVSAGGSGKPRMISLDSYAHEISITPLKNGNFTESYDSGD